MSIIGIIIFFIGWIYSIGAFGFFLGVGIGWIPALFVAIILDFIIVFSLGLIGLAIEKRRFSSFQHKFAKNLPEISPSPNPAPAATPDPISTVRSKAWRSGAALFAIIMTCLFIAAFIASKTAENPYTETTGNYGDNAQVDYERDTAQEYSDQAGTATDDPSSESGQYGNSLPLPPLQDQDFIIEEEGQTPALTVQANPASEELGAPNTYNGPIVYPDFRGRDRAYSSFRTRIIDGMMNGPNFSGHYSIIEIGCGTSCMIAYVADISTGKVYDFPYGGEQYYMMSLKYSSTKNFTEVQWIENLEYCIKENLKWTGSTFVKLTHNVLNKSECNL
ncbi:hypothetical protein [Sphingobium yanoikuyae]|uniref:hypothetical protein n=1 Tax=Sphingobium yanoikuyae TaxID=13690 RepID=UPI000A67DC77|nr:hypothetical protein [Sphingobium yanoikuyae]